MTLQIKLLLTFKQVVLKLVLEWKLRMKNSLFLPYFHFTLGMQSKWAIIITVFTLPTIIIPLQPVGW